MTGAYPQSPTATSQVYIIILLRFVFLAILVCLKVRRIEGPRVEICMKWRAKGVSNVFISADLRKVYANEDNDFCE